jgi:hydroxylamine reductase
MFCYQCEQTAQGKACTEVGVCGKQPETAAMQDLLLYNLKGLSMVAVEASLNDVELTEANRFTVKALFATLTNVDFDPERFVEMIHECVKLRKELIPQITKAGGRDNFRAPEATYTPAADLQGMIADGEKLAGIQVDPALIDQNVHSMQQLLIYGIKGIAAYADHAAILGYESPHVYQFIHQGLSSTLHTGMSVNQMVKLIQRCGEINLVAMELLDKAMEIRSRPRFPWVRKKGRRSWFPVMT